MSQRETGLIKTVFNTDNLVMRISEKIADLVTVNLLFVLSCLPIVTIGIAKISLYQTVFAIKHQRRLPVIRTLEPDSLANAGLKSCVSRALHLPSTGYVSSLSNCGALPIDLGRMPSKSSDCIRFVFPMVLRYGGSLVASGYGVCDFCLKLSTRAHGLLLDWFF